MTPPPSAPWQAHAGRGEHRLAVRQLGGILATSPRVGARRRRRRPSGRGLAPLRPPSRARSRRCGPCRTPDAGHVEPEQRGPDDRAPRRCTATTSASGCRTPGSRRTRGRAGGPRRAGSVMIVSSSKSGVGYWAMDVVERHAAGGLELRLRDGAKTRPRRSAGTRRGRGPARPRRSPTRPAWLMIVGEPHVTCPPAADAAPGGARV